MSSFFVDNLRNRPANPRANLNMGDRTWASPRLDQKFLSITRCWYQSKKFGWI